MTRIVVQKHFTRGAPGVAEQPKTCNLRKFENHKKSKIGPSFLFQKKQIVLVVKNYT